MPTVAQMSDNSQMKPDNMKSGKSMSMTGCISEKDGKYMLMNKEHPNGVALMTSEDMKPHVGHKVKVTGMMMNDSMGKSGSMGKDDSMKSDHMSMMGMKMSSMKMMSTSCDPMK
jgi:hypothetical protein